MKCDHLQLMHFKKGIKTIPHFTTQQQLKFYTLLVNVSII